MIKRVVNCLYVHKSNIEELLSKCNEIYIDTIRNIVSENLTEYEVVKYDKQNETLSLIKSPDWFTANEPIVGDSMIFDLRNNNKCKTVKARVNNPQIYHSKWMFMSDDYDKEWIDKAKQRTNKWNSIPNLDKKRIGNRNFWLDVLDKNGLEV